MKLIVPSSSYCTFNLSLVKKPIYEFKYHPMFEFKFNCHYYNYVVITNNYADYYSNSLFKFDNTPILRSNILTPNITESDLVFLIKHEDMLISFIAKELLFNDNTIIIKDV
jgi:hypothetical protein